MDITRLLRGKKIREVLTNGSSLAIQCDDGSEILIKWVDENGETIKGRPVCGSRGFRMNARNFGDLIHIPGA